MKNPFDDARHHASRRRPCFEGWYFKQSCEGRSFAAIPGIYRGRDAAQDHAFVQVLFSSPSESRFVRYPVEAFSCAEQGFEVRVGPNVFSMNSIRLAIPEIDLEAALDYACRVPLKVSLCSPTIMGPFAYLPGMQCRHGVLSLWHRVNGTVRYGQRKLEFRDGDGYIEKDWGGMFPDSWVWMQCGNREVSLMCAVATIPLKPIRFTGVIGVLRVGSQQYRFATYNGARVTRLHTSGQTVTMEVKRKADCLVIEAAGEEFGYLMAPTNTGMDRRITESLNARYRVTMRRNGDIILNGEYTGGLEMLGIEGIAVRTRRR